MSNNTAVPLLSSLSDQAFRYYELLRAALADEAEGEISDEAIATLLNRSVRSVIRARQECIAAGLVVELGGLTHSKQVPGEKGRTSWTLRTLRVRQPEQGDIRAEIRRLDALIEDRFDQADANPLLVLATPERPAGVVYLIGDRPLVKIGTTIDLDRRLRTLQAASSTPIRVLWSTEGGYRLEAALHHVFAHRRIRGEWFDFGEQDPVPLVEAEAHRLRGLAGGAR